MRHAPALLVAACLAAILSPAPSNAGDVTADVYRSRFAAHDRDGRVYMVDAAVEDRPAGALLVLEVRRRCASCRPDVYAKTLGPDDFTVSYLTFGTECQCFAAGVDAKFGRKPLAIDWVWDPAEGDATADRVEWGAVTANNLMNVACFGSGSLTSMPDPFSGEPPAPPAGAREFPQKLPPGFKIDPLGAPGCYSEGP